jgi:hypothetical protein
MNTMVCRVAPVDPSDCRSPYVLSTSMGHYWSATPFPTIVRLLGCTTRGNYADDCESANVAATGAMGTDTGQALLSKLAEYTSLPADWDGYGGTAASIETFLDAFDFIKQLPSTFPAPKPMIGGAGTIGLYWEGNGCYASVEFDGGGVYCYIADTPEDEHGEDAVAVNSRLPQHLAETIVATADC